MSEVIDIKSAKKVSPLGDRPAQSEVADLVANDLRGQYLFDEVSGEWMSNELGRVAWSPARPLDIVRAVESWLTENFGGYSLSHRSSVTSLLQTRLRAPEWEEGRSLLPFKNGVLDLQTQEFFQITPRHKSSQSSQSSQNAVSESFSPHSDLTGPHKTGPFRWELPYNYEPAAKCPIFREWLESATGSDRELADFLLAWMVAVLRGRSDLQKYLELIGPGGTGKSTFLRICTLLVGDENRFVTDLRNLEGRFESASLYGKRLVQITDSEHYAGQVSILKSITGGDPIRYEVKNRQAGAPFVFGGMVMIATNEVIRSNDYSSGLSRRRIPVCFSRRVTDDEKQHYANLGGIEAVIQDEAPGIVNLLLGMDERMADNLIRNPGPSVERFKFDAELQSNPLLAWAVERLEPCESGSESPVGRKTPADAERFDAVTDISGLLYPSYRDFCDGQGLIPVSLTRFSPAVVDTLTFWGIETEKARQPGTGKAILLGLRLRRPDTPAKLLARFVRTVRTGGVGCED